MTRPNLTLGVALLIVALLCQPAAGAMTGETVIRDTESNLQTQETPNESSNDTTTQPRHQDPSTSGENGDLSDVERYLAGRLGDILGEGTVRLSEGEYEAADRVVGDRYDDELGKYVEVTGRTENTSDDEKADRFEDTSRNFDEFANATKEYQDALDRYREARQAGDEDEAREAAREIDRLVTRVNESGTRLEEDYERLSDESSVDLAEEAETVEEIRTEINRESREVLDAEFIETKL
jgi:hypothetical protein